MNSMRIPSQVLEVDSPWLLPLEDHWKTTGRPLEAQVMGCSILDLIDVKALALALRQSQAALGDPLAAPAFHDSDITCF